MSCSDSCALFFKKKSMCVSDPCASVGLNCRSYGAGDNEYDCKTWCCERDSSTLAVFVVVIIILVICCGFCCAFAVYRFILRKKDQSNQQGVEEADVFDVDNDDHRKKPKQRKRRGSQDSTFTTSSYGAPHRHDEYTSSQGKTTSGHQRNVEYDEYSESGYTARSGQTRQTEQETYEDAPETGFLDEPTASARSGRSGWSEASAPRGKQLGDSDTHYYEEQYSARSGQSATGKQRGVWNGDVGSAYYETPRSTQGREHRSPRQQRGQAQHSEDNLFNFEEDF